MPEVVVAIELIILCLMKTNMPPESKVMIPNEQNSVTGQKRLDESMVESFSAGDPPSWSAEISHHSAPLIKESIKRARQGNGSGKEKAGC